MKMSIPAKIPFLRAFSSRTFALLWFGQTISLIGNGIFTTAIAWMVVLKTDSALTMGLVSSIKVVPMLFFLLIGGATVDRFSRRLVMLYSDISRAIVVFFAALLYSFNIFQVWHLTILLLVFSIIGSFFNPAYNSITAQLVLKEDLTSANALKGLSDQMNTLLGPILGAACVAFAGPGFAMLVDGITFVVSACCIFCIKYRPEENIAVNTYHPDRAIAQKLTKGFSQLVKDIRDGILYTCSVQWLWLSILIASIANIGIMGSFVVVLPKLMKTEFGSGGVWLLGIISIADVFGSLLIALILGHISTLKKRGILLYIAIMMCGISLAAYNVQAGYMSLLLLLSLASFINGLSLGAFDILWQTLLQEFVPFDRLGRVYSLDSIGSYCLMPLGYIFMGALADLISPGFAFLLGGMLCIILAIIGLSFKAIRTLQ